MGTETLKRCCRCHAEKSLDDFGKNRSTRDGFAFECTECVKKRARFYYSRNRDAIIIKASDYYRRTKPDRLAWSQQYKTSRREILAATQRAYQKRNRPKINAYKTPWQKKRRAENLNFRLRCLLSGRVTCAVRRQSANKCNKTAQLIGCSIEYLKLHLASLFQSGMSWSNYGRGGWNVDHAIPCAKFDLRDPVQQRRCFHYSNLQPLWEIDNQRKGAS